MRLLLSAAVLMFCMKRARTCDRVTWAGKLTSHSPTNDLWLTCFDRLGFTAAPVEADGVTEVSLNEEEMSPCRLSSDLNRLVFLQAQRPYEEMGEEGRRSVYWFVFPHISSLTLLH